MKPQTLSDVRAGGVGCRVMESLMLAQVVSDVASDSAASWSRPARRWVSAVADAVTCCTGSAQAVPRDRQAVPDGFHRLPVIESPTSAGRVRAVRRLLRWRTTSGHVLSAVRSGTVTRSLTLCVRSISKPLAQSRRRLHLNPVHRDTLHAESQSGTMWRSLSWTSG